FYFFVFWAVMLCWFVFASAFLLRTRPPKNVQMKRSNGSLAGILIVAIGYAVVWSFRRPTMSAILPMVPYAQAVVDVLTVAIAVGSVWIALSAVRALGKQWSPSARLVEGHKLIVDGPFRFVRHPIYLGMLGLMVATGLAVSYFYLVILAILIAVAGTMIRVHFEEKLLREAFGFEFDAYRRKVPAFIPWL
ncbi:MAG: isoprenylcysteine carboxylmethyltransferase family protein, partial [Acidobacteriota bacterium]